MSCPIRILHLITSLDTGGAEISLARLLEGINHEKFESRVVSLIPIGAVGQKIRARGIQVETLGMPPGKPSIRGVAKLVQILRTYQPEILQTWLYHADLLGLLAGKLTGVPSIAWNIRSAEMDFKEYRPLSGLVVKFCALLSSMPNTIIINSQAGIQHHQKLGYHPKTWQMIPNGIDTNFFKPDRKIGAQFRKEFQITNSSILIGLVGRLDPMKDHKTFLLAAAKVQQEIKQAQFICVGDGTSIYRKSLEVFAQNIGVKNIIWAGTQTDMPAVYNALDCLALSSKGEGFPNVIAEAMACGVPCVATNVGDVANIIGKSGKIIPVGNAEALANELLAVLNLSSTQKQALAFQARERIKTKFSIEEMVSAYENLYTELAK